MGGRRYGIYLGSEILLSFLQFLCTVYIYGNEIRIEHTLYFCSVCGVYIHFLKVECLSVVQSRVFFFIVLVLM
jgi:hypothetical protein